MAGSPIGVGTCQEHHEIGAAREGGPRLDAAHEAPALGGPRAHSQVRDVGVVVGLGDHHADHQLAGCDPRQPAVLLLLGAPLTIAG